MKSLNKRIKHSTDNKLTALLWTGGYDSTFRLLQLLYIEKKEVQPIYVIDLSHRSPVHELISMNEIRNELKKRGEVVGRLKPTIYVDKSGIEIDDEISEAWANIKQRRHIGKQYIWIASLCKQYNLRGIELSVEKDNEDSVSESIACYLVPNRMTPDMKIIFKYFSLPLINMTRKDMQRIINKEKWSDMMERTWFCHHPIYHPFKKGIPCGICNPCRITIEEGFGDRIPFLLRHSGKYLKKIYNSSIMNRLKRTKI